MDNFLKNGIIDYKEGRNFPSRNNVSMLSPHLHFGEISPKRIWINTKNLKSNKDTQHFLSEICWREFSYYLLYHFPSLPSLLFDLETDPLEMTNLAEDKKYDDVKNTLMSELLSHRIRHQDRQLSSLQVSKDGVARVNGPQSRKMIN